MSTSYCKHCGQETTWHWEEAYDKFGFNDGDGLVMTEVIADALEHAGYDVRTFQWGFHNTLIQSIKKDGDEYIDL